MIRIELDSVRKDMNRSEWRNINRAWAVLPGTWTTLQSAGDMDNKKSPVT